MQREPKPENPKTQKIQKPKIWNVNPDVIWLWYVMKRKEFKRKYKGKWIMYWNIDVLVELVVMVSNTSGDALHH